VLTAAMVLAAAAGGAGCQGKPGGGTQAGGGTAAITMSAEDLYAAGRFSEAKARAEVDYRQISGAAKRRSALTAGMASHALGQTAEARGWLEPLLKDHDPQIAGRAAAALGLIAQSQKDPTRAASLLEQASHQLSGDLAARASLRAGHAQTELNQFAQAKASYDTALTQAQSSELKSAIVPYTVPGPYSLQVGVFGSKPNADRKAREIQAQIAQLGYGWPQVTPRTGSDGKPSFAVRVGRFVNRYAAVLAGGRLGVPAVVVKADE
jgi:tetratricopeptide (TPR) repeat protein